MDVCARLHARSFVRVSALSAVALIVGGCTDRARTPPPDVYLAVVASEDGTGPRVRLAESGEECRVDAEMLRLELAATHPSWDALGLPAVQCIVAERTGTLEAWTLDRLDREIVVVLGATAVFRGTLDAVLDDDFLLTTDSPIQDGLLRRQLMPEPRLHPSTWVAHWTAGRRAAARAPGLVAAASHTMAVLRADPHPRRAAVQFTEVVDGGRRATRVWHARSGETLEVDPRSLRVEIARSRRATDVSTLELEVHPDARRALDDWTGARIGRRIAVLLGHDALLVTRLSSPLGATFTIELPPDLAAARLIEEQLSPRPR